MGTPGSSTWTVLPTPPEMGPVRIRLPVTPTALGLMTSSVLVLWDTLKLVLQDRPPVGDGSRRRAVRPRSNPVFFTLPMFLVTKFERNWPAAPTSQVRVDSHLMFGSTPLGRAGQTNWFPNCTSACELQN